VRRHLEYEQLHACLGLKESFDLEQLWRWTDQKELVGRRGGKEFLPAEPLDVESLGVSPRPVDDVALPNALLEPVTSYLSQEYGCKPALARAMAKRAAQIRYWCCPRINELKPGQVVWLAYSTRSSKRGQSRLLVPVALTLLTPEEQSLTLSNRGDFKHLKVRQLERITAEAWQQDGVLTMLDLEWLLNVNGAFLKTAFKRLPGELRCNLAYGRHDPGYGAHSHPQDHCGGDVLGGFKHPADRPADLPYTGGGGQLLKAL